MPFPPGGTKSHLQHTPSLWREFSFMHHQVLQWLDPRFGLEQVLENWPVIAAGLAERSRSRQPQVPQFFKARKTS